MVFCLLETQESGALQKLLGAQISWRGLLGDAGRKGSKKRLCKRGNQRGQNVRKGKEGRDEARVVWTGCPQVTEDGASGSSQGCRWGGCRGGAKRGRRELRCPSGGPQSARKAASLGPLRDQNRWGGAPTTQCSRCKFKFQRHPRQSPQRSVKGRFFHGAPLGLQSCLSGWKRFASPLNWHITLPHKATFGINPRRGEASFSPTRFDWQLLGSGEQPEASLPLTREPYCGAG